MLTIVLVRIYFVRQNMQTHKRKLPSNQEHPMPEEKRPKEKINNILQDIKDHENQSGQIIHLTDAKFISLLKFYSKTINTHIGNETRRLSIQLECFQTLYLATLYLLNKEEQHYTASNKVIRNISTTKLNIFWSKYPLKTNHIPEDYKIYYSKILVSNAQEQQRNFKDTIHAELLQKLNIMLLNCQERIKDIKVEDEQDVKKFFPKQGTDGQGYSNLDTLRSQLTALHNETQSLYNNNNYKMKIRILLLKINAYGYLLTGNDTYIQQISTILNTGQVRYQITQYLTIENWNESFDIPNNSKMRKGICVRIIKAESRTTLFESGTTQPSKAANQLIQHYQNCTDVFKKCDETLKLFSVKEIPIVSHSNETAPETPND